MKTLRCKLQKQLNILYIYGDCICVCVCIILYIYKQSTYESISKLNSCHFFRLPAVLSPCSSVNKCKQISCMFFIVIYLFHVIYFFSSFHSRFFLFFFVQRDIGDCAECRCRVWKLFHVCYLSVRVCVWASVWVNEPVCVSVPIVFMWNKQFLRASLKFLETRPLRMFSNYKQFQCSSSSASGKLLLLLLLFFILLFIYLFIVFFFFALPNKSYTQCTVNYHRVNEHNE